MPHSVLLSEDDSSTLKYIVTHVFCPLQLPDGDDHSVANDYALVCAVSSASRFYCERVSQTNLADWYKISRMLGNLAAVVRFETLDVSRTISQLHGMEIGDVLAFLIRAQNAAVVFRKQEDVTIFESFEVSPKAQDAMNTQGKLASSYPGPSIAVSNLVFEDKNFLSELVNFLVHMNDDILDAAATSRKAQSTVLETRDTTNPCYITELLTGILRSLGRPADVVRINKRIGDDVVWNNSELPWRRSSLWLLIRVALQTTLNRSALSNDTYKPFVLFFLCCLAKEKAVADFPNDLLQFMLAKISRRLRKLGPSAPGWLSYMVVETCIFLRSILEMRWKLVRAAQRVSPVWTPSQLDLTRDIELSLLSSGDYLRNALNNQTISSAHTPFGPEHRPRGSLDQFLSSDGDFFKEAYGVEPHIALYDVERAVQEGIDHWVDQVTDTDNACEKLELLANQYSECALKTYRSNPELLSVMLLTTIELWVALDKLVVKEISMLKDYSPEIPARLLENLLLCKGTNLNRLCRVHQYISHRHSESQWSIFSQRICENNFAIRFYRSSSSLQRLKSCIEESAQRERRNKVSELENANARFAELQRKAARASHEYAINRRGDEYHVGNCNKCILERECNNMRITVHEWPLPAEELSAEVVVFELNCPIAFNMWRSATFHLLVDLCSPSVQPQSPYVLLRDYDALRCYLIQHSRSRITLASNTKPFVVTHYRRVSVPSTEERVCVQNGLKFYGYDSDARIPVSEVLDGIDIQKYCTYSLASDPYKKLQGYVAATSHSSNDVIANQAMCHKDLSIHEYMAFGHLRSGESLQWLNILRELRGRSLTFRHNDVHLLLAQTTSQVGPLEDSEWMWHQEIQEPAFCDALLGELGSLVRDVEANWLEVVTMDTVSFLLRRLLASNPEPAISLRAIQLLRVVRGKVFSWVEELSAKLTKSPGDEEFRGVLRDSAAICRSTFDVDPAMIPQLLHSPADVEVLVCSAVFIHDHTPTDISCLSEYSRLLLDRDRRVSLLLENTLSDLIQADPNDEGMDSAVRMLWPTYQPGSKWDPLEGANSRWFSCETTPTAEECAQVAHYNVLNGLLLVDGKPLGRLPGEILQHSTYTRIFGKQVLDVVPSRLLGMDYSTRAMISGHEVHFSLTNKTLVIRAKRTLPSGSEIIELIPQERFKGDLPAVLIEGHAHWLNLSTSVLEIRPLENLWESSSENWQICCILGQYRMQNSQELLVDIRSRSWKMVSGLLEPFDVPENLIVTVRPIDASKPLSSQLSVVLPRYGLSFYLDEDGDLQSQNMHGMIYDKDQSLGTLFGLVNKLVLRPKTSDMRVVELAPRCVLIPDGKVLFKKDDHHVQVRIDIHGPALQRSTYHSYRIDTDLGCLTGTVGLTNNLYRAYLHALTSGCSADPLTGRSGTEEALSLLRSASCWSFIKFTPRDAELLRLIASICPSRTWYPPHLKSMQKVEWRNLPVASQHHDLYVVSKAIKEQYEKVQLFHESKTDMFRTFPHYDAHLLERSARRAAYLFPSILDSGMPSTENFDVPYSARDLVADISGSGEHRAYTVAAAICRQSPHAVTSKDILSMMESWTEDVSGDTFLSLRYDESWLKPDLPLIWLKVYDLLRAKNERKWFELLFSVTTMVYASPKLSDIVPVFVAFASNPLFRSEDPPSFSSYAISDRYIPSAATLRSYLSKCAHSFERSPESSERAGLFNENLAEVRQRQYRLYCSRLNSDTDTTVDRLMGAWPCETLPRFSLNSNSYDVAKFKSDAQGHFSSCYRNLKLKEHIGRVQNILDHGILSTPLPALAPRYSFHPSQASPSEIYWSLTTEQLLERPPPLLYKPDKLKRCITELRLANTLSSHLGPLHHLIDTAEANAVDSFQSQYVSALRASAECLGNDLSLAYGSTKLPTAPETAAHYTCCRDHYNEALDDLKNKLSPQSPSELALGHSGQWPRITPYSLFRLLASSSPIVISEDWKTCLITLALIALELQRARRLLRLRLQGLSEDVRRELDNEGCDGWTAETHPDWLLIQLQGNFLVRRVQAEVANEMISPRSGTNTAMQLNMGEGKSSVIVPIVVSALANGQQLVRVIVPKVLTVQMFQILVDRLGGLANRRIYFLPFSRSLELDFQGVAGLHKLMSECMKEGGILIAQPEHLLSLKLLSVEKQLSKERVTEVAKRVLKLQRWLHSHSRDILDESDEILHVRYQLVYTIGAQQHMEGFPRRWTTTEQVLSLVKMYAPSLRILFPHGVEYDCGPPGSFPHLRILHADAGKTLIAWIVKDVIDGFLPNFNFGQLRPTLKESIRTFIFRQDVPADKVQLVKDYTQKTSLWGGLLHLRGLLATGILLFAFKERRWRVDYGLSPARTMLAVPYRAKDVPAQRAEFGHPDIAIILTCLSYYYNGLTQEQLGRSFEILLKQDDPTLDYDLWIRDCPAVPESLKTLNGINIKSSEQWTKYLYPLFSRNQGTIDFYLSNVVFPKEAKEFPSKLSCSGWDLAEKKQHVLTGFSGTNDGQYLLPSHITQRDPDHQMGTNAKVLSYLLQTENKYYMCMRRPDGERRPTHEFLKTLAAQKPTIRVLLDVGAQMLDLQNAELAEAWLDVDPDVSAAIYFNEDDELTVRARDGRTHLFLSSPFAQQLDQCVVYLDDAHTRGTDIKFPKGFRAAVTLGPKVTKDRLVQGCMRMRKLGHGHSIMFFAPLEIDRRIRFLAQKHHSDVIDTVDILHWAIQETCSEIQQRAPHWAQQGMDHNARYDAWNGYCNGRLSSKALAAKWLQPEAKRLEELYWPREGANSSLLAHLDIHQHCVELGVLSLRDVGMDEEQEREVIHEVERERQVERPPKVPPASHEIYPDFIRFITTGNVSPTSEAFRPAFQTLASTSVSTDEAHIWSPNVLATMDFERTVRLTGRMDEYLRSVQWVATGKRAGKEALVILSPHEANYLMRSIRSGGYKVQLHVYTPRVTRSMTPCDDLSLYSVPTVPIVPSTYLMDQLNVFSGQLFLKDYETYIRLCRFLCVYARDLEAEEGIDVEAGCDGFIAPINRPKHLKSVYTFQSSPLESVKTLVSIRRKGMGFAPTHMGYLLDGRLLSEKDFDPIYEN